MAWGRFPRLRRHILDKFTAKDVRGWQAYWSNVLLYHWEYFSSLAHQRSQRSSQICEALLVAVKGPLEFGPWQRVTRWKWSNHPLSVTGSTKDPIGGRFNIGGIDPTKFHPFPALYIAENKETALQEVICNAHPSDGSGGLTGLELALVDPSSLSNIALRGRIESYVDLFEMKPLRKFISLLKTFEPPSRLTKFAKALGIDPPTLIADQATLVRALLDDDWKVQSMLVDHPAASQIFGQLVREAKIEAIRYPSKYSGAVCLAIFPENFEGTDSFVEVVDTPPTEGIITRLDRTTWRSLL